MNELALTESEPRLFAGSVILILRPSARNHSDASAFDAPGMGAGVLARSDGSQSSSEQRGRRNSSQRLATLCRTPKQRRVSQSQAGDLLLASCLPGRGGYFERAPVSEWVLLRDGSVSRDLAVVLDAAARCKDSVTRRSQRRSPTETRGCTYTLVPECARWSGERSLSMLPAIFQRNQSGQRLYDMADPVAGR